VQCRVIPRGWNTGMHRQDIERLGALRIGKGCAIGDGRSGGASEIWPE
jgi:hypothetical protein